MPGAVERSLSRLNRPIRRVAPALGSGIRPEAPLEPSLATFDREQQCSAVSHKFCENKAANSRGVKCDEFCVN